MRRRNIEPLLVDLDSLEESRFVLSEAGLVIEVDGRTVALSVKGGLARGWIRRLATSEWRKEAVPGSYAAAVRTAWINLFVSIAHGLGIKWLTDLGEVTLAENKAYQLLIARQLGLRVPRTIIANNRDDLDDALGESVVVKPLGPGAYRDVDGATRVVHANLVDRASSIFDGLSGAPFLVQEKLEANVHLRVVTVSDEAWVCALPARDLPLDWRREPIAHDSFEVTHGFEDVADDALRLARQLAVGYSSQDWIVTGNSYWFLDLNPAGQWLFLPLPVRGEVTEALVGWLAADS